jgi:hypothetical protein
MVYYPKIGLARWIQTYRSTELWKYTERRLVAGGICLHRLELTAHLRPMQRAVGTRRNSPRVLSADVSAMSWWTRTGGNVKGSESAGRYQDGVYGFHAARLRDAEMRGAMLSWAILNGASLRWASLVNLWTIPTQLAQTNLGEGEAQPDGEKQAETPSRVLVTEQ